MIGGTPHPPVNAVMVPATVDRELENIGLDRTRNGLPDLVDRRIPAPAQISLDPLVVKAIEIVEAERIKGARFIRPIARLNAGAFAAAHQHRPEIARQLRSTSE